MESLSINLINVEEEKPEKVSSSRGRRRADGAFFAAEPLERGAAEPGSQGADDHFHEPPTGPRGASPVPVAAPSRTAQGRAARGQEPQSRAFPVSRLLGLADAARYLGCTYWTVRDMVANGTLPAVRLPATRLDVAPRRNGKPTRRVLVPAGDARLGSLRRLLVDVRDLDELVERSKGRV